MEFKFTTLSISDLVQLINSDKIDLKPYYQRNDIWTRADQESLIDSIIKRYPLPSFFIHHKKDGMLEMVDGQQRARTIFRFVNGVITNSKGQRFSNLEQKDFLEYPLSVTEIYGIDREKEIEEFYVLVNRKGKHLNTPEIHKAEFAGSNFLKLSEDLLELQSFMNLNLFTDATSRRMNDRNYIEELIAYLLHGIQDKKKIIELIYDQDLHENEVEEIKKKFQDVINIADLLNEYFPISKTRYKQKNDFYTLFNFIHENISEKKDVFLFQYKILLKIEEYISPANEECMPFREYALNCVSQSNSKKARLRRLNFFNSVLKNKDENIEQNGELSEIVNYLDHKWENLDFERINGYYLINPQA